MVEFNEKLPKWEAEGVEPPKTKQEEGWDIGDRPPAEWFNWLQNRTYKSLEELQEVAIQLGIDIENIDVTEDLDALAEELRKEIDKRVLKEDGKGLSTNDYTDEDKTLVDTIKDKADKTYVDEQDLKLQQDVESKYEELNDRVSQHTIDIGDKADKTYVDSRDNEIIGDLKFVESKADENRASISAKVDTGEVSTEHYRQVNASNYSTASGGKSQVNASSYSKASGVCSQVNTSYHSTVTGNYAQVNSSAGSLASFEGSQVNSSQAVAPRKDYTVVGGYGPAGATPSPNNITWELDSKNGEVYAKNDFKLGNISIKDELDSLKLFGVESNKILVDALNSKEVQASTRDTIKTNVNKVNEIKVGDYSIGDVINIDSLGKNKKDSGNPKHIWTFSDDAIKSYQDIAHLSNNDVVSYTSDYGSYILARVDGETGKKIASITFSKHKRSLTVNAENEILLTDKDTIYVYDKNLIKLKTISKDTILPYDTNEITRLTYYDYTNSYLLLVGKKIINLDSNFNSIWSYTSDSPFSIEKVPYRENNILVVKRGKKSGNVVHRIDSNGMEIPNSNISIPNTTETIDIMAIQIDYDNNIIMAIREKNRLIKFSPNNDILFDIQLPFRYVRYIAIHKDGDFLIAGTFDGFYKYNSNGTPKWQELDNHFGPIILDEEEDIIFGQGFGYLRKYNVMETISYKILK